MVPMKQQFIIQVSRKWRTAGVLRCRRDYRKREKNVKKILLNLFADLAVFESGT
jgi:glyoxylate carboligase